MQDFWMLVNMIWFYVVGILSISLIALVITWWEDGKRCNFKDFWKTF